MTIKMNKFFLNKKDNWGHTGGNKGFTLVEVLIYIVVMLIMLGVIFGVVVSFVQANRKIKISKNIESSAIAVFERITREIHDAKDINMMESLFNSNPGVLELSTTDNFGNDRVVKFYVDAGQIIHMNENGVDIGALTLQDVKATNLIFKLVSTPNSKAVRIEMTLQSGSNNEVKVNNFYNTAILRSK